MIIAIVFFIVTALFFYYLGYEEGVREEKENTKRIIKRCKNMYEIKVRFRIK